MRDVFFLTCGTMKMPGFALAKRGSLVTFTNTVGVVERDSGDVLLVDSGWSGEGLSGRFSRARVRPEDTIVAQLEALGIARSRVKTVVATHMHYDHIGGVRDFPDAEIVCTAPELEAFRSLLPSAGYRKKDLPSTARVRPVELAQGPAYGFPASFDLFGDGEVVMLDARGHTRGSAAVALRTRETSYVHIGDAAYLSWEYGVSPRGPSLFARVAAWSVRELVTTYGRIRSCEADARHPVIVPSHDAHVFERLPHTRSEEPRASAKRNGIRGVGSGV